MEDDRHLMAAEIPTNYTPDVLIVESTFGVQNHAPKEEREKRSVLRDKLESSIRVATIRVALPRPGSQTKWPASCEKGDAVCCPPSRWGGLRS
jgi:hypothetical protein